MTKIAGGLVVVVVFGDLVAGVGFGCLVAGVGFGGLVAGVGFGGLVAGVVVGGLDAGVDAGVGSGGLVAGVGLGGLIAGVGLGGLIAGVGLGGLVVSVVVGGRRWCRFQRSNRWLGFGSVVAGVGFGSFVGGGADAGFGCSEEERRCGIVDFCSDALVVGPVVLVNGRTSVLDIDCVGVVLLSKEVRILEVFTASLYSLGPTIGWLSPEEEWTVVVSGSVGCSMLLSLLRRRSLTFSCSWTSLSITFTV